MFYSISFLGLFVYNKYYMYEYIFLILLLLKFYVVNKLGLKYIGYDKIEN